MGAGIPGTGMATLFYILSVFVMPLREIVRTVRGQSSWARWKLIARHLVIALAMTAVVYGTFRYLPGLLLPPDTTIGGVSALAVTGVLFVLYLTVVNLLALLVPGKVELPQSKAFPERRSAVRVEGPAPVFHPQRARTFARSPSQAIQPEGAPPRTIWPVAQLPLNARRPEVAVGVARHRAAKSERRRTRPLAWASISIAVVLGLFLGLIRAAGGEPPADGVVAGSTQSADPRQSTESSGLSPLPAAAETPSEQLRETITALADLATRDPDFVGPAADDVLASLRAVEPLELGARQSAAVVANTSVGAAVTAGELEAGVGQHVQEVLDSVARPARLIDLIALIGADPAALGPAGPGLLDPLIALDHQVPADETAATAAALLQRVTDSAEQGELSEAFQTAAVPTLQGLADPASYSALLELVVNVEHDPSGIGPAGQQVLESLRASLALPVFPQGNEVLSLLEFVKLDGQVTSAFRAAAIPVLVPLVR